MIVYMFDTSTILLYVYLRIYENRDPQIPYKMHSNIITY